MIGRMLGKGDFARAKENSDSMLKLVFMIQVISGGLIIYNPFIPWSTLRQYLQFYSTCPEDVSC